MAGWATRWRFRWDYQGFNQARNSEPVQSWVLDAAKAAAGRAGDGYDADVRAGRTRAQARIVAVTAAADADNRRNNTILKAGDGGGS